MEALSCRNNTGLAVFLGIFILIIAIFGCGDSTISPEDDCTTQPKDPLPIPTNLTNPDTAYFDEPFTVSWDHVWTGCGGYEFEYRRAATSIWGTVDVSSGSETDVTILKPSPPVNNPTSYEIRVRSYWESSENDRIYSGYSQSGNVEMALPCQNACSTPATNPMPVPTNLSNPDTASFDVPFVVSWDHVWIGCGGYEFMYRRAGTSTWVTIIVVSGSTASVTIQLPSPPVNDPTSYELRVRSYWGGDCDTKVYSEYSQSSNIEMRVPKSYSSVYL